VRVPHAAHAILAAVQLASEADKPPFAAAGAEAPRVVPSCAASRRLRGKRRAAWPPAREGGLSAYWQGRWTDGTFWCSTQIVFSA